MSFARVVSALLLGSFLAFAGCAASDKVDVGEPSDEGSAALALSFQELDVRKSDAPAGLTILRKKSEYQAFFGVSPPSSLSFNSSWVIHYSMGVENTGGYDANILGVERTGVGASAHLHVRSQDVSPGPNCLVTESLTNPQVTVKISKQNAAITIDHEPSAQVTDCGTVQSWCATAVCAPGQTCDEFTDSCVDAPFCVHVKCTNGFVCDEGQRACIGAPCDPDDAASCPTKFTCENEIRCITTPCPTDYRCKPAPVDPCDAIGWVGTCDGTLLQYCVDDAVISVECAPGACGYSSADAYYDCL